MILVLYNAAGKVVGRDAVKFDVQNSDLVPDWIVPSGWYINGENSLTTMKPQDDAVGPMREGSYYENNDADKRGHVQSKETYSDGFVMQFDYEFVRNGVDGYLQADTSGDEKTPDGDLKKVSFVGNSGIKLGGYKGTGDGITEVAILDMEKMVALVGGVENFKNRIDNTTGEVNLSNIEIKPGEFVSYEAEPLSGLLNGVVYALKGNVDGLKNNIVGALGKSYQEIFVENYNLFTEGGGKLKIIYIGGTLTVSYWNQDINDFTPYYIASGVTIPDGHVYIQSHWGSGVKYSNLSIE